MSSVVWMTLTGGDPDIVTTPKSKDLRDKIAHEAGQLPVDALNVVAVGSIHGSSRDTEAALYGDPRDLVEQDGSITHARLPNGLFAAPDDVCDADAWPVGAAVEPTDDEAAAALRDARAIVETIRSTMGSTA